MNVLSSAVVLVLLADSAARAVAARVSTPIETSRVSGVALACPVAWVVIVYTGAPVPPIGAAAADGACWREAQPVKAMAPRTSPQAVRVDRFTAVAPRLSVSPVPGRATLRSAMAASLQVGAGGCRGRQHRGVAVRASCPLRTVPSEQEDVLARAFGSVRPAIVRCGISTP